MVASTEYILSPTPCTSHDLTWVIGIILMFPGGKIDVYARASILNHTGSGLPCVLSHFPPEFDYWGDSRSENSKVNKDLDNGLHNVIKTFSSWVVSEIFYPLTAYFHFRNDNYNFVPTLNNRINLDFSEADIFIYSSSLLIFFTSVIVWIY